MTMVNTRELTYWPGIVGVMASFTGVGAGATLDASGEYVSWVMQAREDMAITHVWFRINTSTAGNITVGIEQVDATTGMPTAAPGTLWATSTVTATTAVTAATAYTVALGATATIAKGQVFAVVIRWISGVCATNAAGAAYAQHTSFPYQVANAGTPTKAAIGSAQAGALGLGSSSSTWYSARGVLPLNAAVGGAFSNASADKRRGALITLPWKRRVIGLRTWMGATNGNFNYGALDGTAHTEINSSITALDGDQMGNLATGVVDLYFDHYADFEASTAYRVYVEPTSTTTITFTGFSCANADLKQGFPIPSTGFEYTSYNGTSWSETSTAIPILDLIFAGYDDGAGGGGGPTTGSRVFGS